MKKKKVLRTKPNKIHLEGGIVGRISGAKLRRELHKRVVKWWYLLHD